MTFRELLDNEEARALIDEIEYLADEEEPCDVEYRNHLIRVLRDHFGFEY